MRPRFRPLRLFAQIASGLGFLSVSLTGEIAASWLMAGWTAWFLSLILDRFPRFLARVRQFETAAVGGMIAMLVLDFFVFHFTIFIAITHFLLLFQIVKLIGEKARKDCFQIFLFSFFQILAACTLSVDAWHAAVLLGLIPTATATLFWNQIEREAEQAGGTIDLAVHRHYRRMATGICLVALPLNLILTVGVFVLFPRLTVNASLPGFSGHRTGYTDQMNLAQKGSLQQDSSVVLWLNFSNNNERSAWNGYLRGDVLNYFDGRQWTASKTSGSRLRTPDTNGIFVIRQHQPGAPLIHQTITLADTSAATIFAISKPIRILAPLPALQETDEGSLHWLVPWRRPLRYEAVSEPFSETEVRAVDDQLPRIPLKRIRDLVRQIAGTGSPLEQAQKILVYLQKNYRYSIDFGDQIPDNPVDYFLFERRQGSCAHFASAMALMLRLQNIPSRVVAGYFKGEWNEPAQSVVIRERDAHAWVEAYLPGQGWVSFDPTPLQAAGAVSRRNLLTIFEPYWVYLDLQWNRFVIQYDLYSQIKAFENLKGTSGRLGLYFAKGWSKIQFSLSRRRHFEKRSLETSTGATARFPWTETVLFLFLTLVSSLGLIHQHRKSHDSPVRFYKQFLDRMARAGHPKAPGETGKEFAARLETGWPEEGVLAREVTARYYHIRFRRTSR